MYNFLLILYKGEGMKIKKLTDKKLEKAFFRIIEQSMDCTDENVRLYVTKYQYLLFHIRKRDIFGWGKYAKHMNPLDTALQYRINECNKKIKQYKQQILDIKQQIENILS